MSLPFIPTACETSAIRVCYLFPPCWRLWGFFCRSVWGTVNSHVCKCTRNDVSDVLLCARLCECESWLFPLEFPENPDSLLQHIILWHSVLGMVHAVLTQLSFPFTLPCSVLLRTFFCCSICTFSFVPSCILLEQLFEGVFFLFCFFQQPHIGNYTKLKIIAWPVNACAAQTHFILGSSFSRIEQKLQTYSRWSKITLEWLAGLKSAFLGTFRTSCSIREPPFGKYSVRVRVHVCLEILFIFLRVGACIFCWICLYLCYF